MNASFTNTTSVVDMTETNLYLKEIISIVSCIFISVISIGVVVILCLCICNNLDIIKRIIRSCCFKCECCDGDNEYTDDDVEKLKKFVVILPHAKVMDVC